MDKEYDFLLLPIILLCIPSPHVNKIYLRKSYENNLCAGCTLVITEFYLILPNLVYKMPWKSTFIKVFEKEKKEKIIILLLRMYLTHFMPLILFNNP